MVKYLYAQAADSSLSHDDAMRKVATLMKDKQCYTYAVDKDTINFAVDPGTREVSVKTVNVEQYHYDERALLKGENIGSFGFGIKLKIGSDMAKFTPANYDYVEDPYNLRWKHVDEVYGKV